MTATDPTDDSDAPEEPRPPTADEQSVDGQGDDDLARPGWLLVAIIVFSFVVAPGLVLLNPPALPFRVAYLILPLLPAVLLGATAVWVALRGGSDRRRPR